MKIAVTGATGFIGRALCNELAKEHDVTALTRNPEKASVLLDKSIDITRWDPKTPGSWENRLDGTDAIVNLAGTSLASGRWTEALKDEILNSRLSTIRALIGAAGNARVRPKVFVASSAVGFYGDRADETVDEESAAGSGFLAEVCRKIENASEEAESLGIRLVVIRTGLVLGAGGGALPKMVQPFKLHLGGWLGSGRQWISWISLADEVAAVKFLIENTGLRGPFNLTCPRPVRNRDFFQTLAAVLEKPCRLPVPAFALRAMFGHMADELFLTGQRVYPRRLTEAGFDFKNIDLQETLESMNIAKERQ